MASLEAHKGFSPAKWLRYHIFEKRLNTYVGYFLMAAMAVGVAYMSVFMSYKGTLMFTGVFAFAVVGVACVLFPYFGYYVTIIVSCLIRLCNRDLQLPHVTWRYYAGLCKAPD
jgi:hypothetical protein